MPLASIGPVLEGKRRGRKVSSSFIAVAILNYFSRALFSKRLFYRLACKRKLVKQ